MKIETDDETKILAIVGGLLNGITRMETETKGFQIKGYKIVDGQFRVDIRTK